MDGLGSRRWLPSLGPLRALPYRQPVDRARQAVEVLTPHVQIDRGGHKAGMSQQLADCQQIDARFEHAGRVRVSQRIHTLPANSVQQRLFIGFTRFMVTR
jgi:hypothetical protein